jgi:hypothetical protein
MNFKEAYPHLLKYWDKKKNTKSADNVHSGTRKYEVYFICENNHSFSILPCRIKSRKTKDLNCEICINGNKPKLFKDAHPNIVKYWDYNKNKDKSINLETLTRGSALKCYFKCKEGHEVIKRPSHLSSNITDVFNCNICSGVNVVDSTRLDITYPEISSEWDSIKNKKTQKEVSYLSDKKYWWKCKNNHSWKAGISDRTGFRNLGRSPSKCPHCWQKTISRNELIIYSELHQFFNEVYSTYKVNNKHLDIFIKDINLAVEYDGHHWHKDKLDKDLDRNIFLSKSNIKTLRIRELPLPKIEVQDIQYNNFEEDLFYVIIKILNFILNNYKLTKKTKNKIECYIKNEKITNQVFFKEVEDSYRIKKIENPILFEDYDKEKNKLPLHYYGQGSSYRANWKCKSCCFEYKKPISEKNNTPTCQNCKKIEKDLNPTAKKKIIYVYKLRLPSERKDLRIKNTHPEVLCELPKDRMEELQELNYSNVPVYFNSTCSSCSFVFKTNLWSKINLKQGCPNCNFNIYKEETSLLKDYPFLEKTYDNSNTINLKYTEINLSKQLNWKCKKGHITKESLKKKITNPSCKKCESSAVISTIPRVFDTWNFEKNKDNGIDPYKRTMGVKKKAHFKCNVAPDHEWEVPICNRVKYDCPFCSNNRLSVTNRFDLKYPKITDMWSANNTTKPSEFMYGYAKIKHLWNCNCCDKEFSKEICQMIRTNASCPECNCYNVGENKGKNRHGIRNKKNN